MTDQDVVIALTRLELKIDQLISTSSDHESRLRTLEMPKGYVTGKQLWAALLGVAAVMGSLGTVAAFFFGH